jgi:hypothetical protein
MRVQDRASGEDRHVSAAISANGGASGAVASARADAGLSDVTRNLASFQAPEMPSGLAARLDRALAAESAWRDAGQQRGAGGSVDESQQESGHDSTAQA